MAQKYPKLSETLKKLLFERNMKPIQLARELDLPQPTVHRLVTGKSTRPYQSSLEPIAEYFSVSVEQLLGLEPLMIDEAKTNDEVELSKQVKVLPVLSWGKLVEWNKARAGETDKEIIVAGNLGSKVFAVEMPDYSMEPLFQKGATLIFDADVMPYDRSYVLIKLAGSNTYVFRQLLIDAEQKYIKSLNPDISANSTRLLQAEDLIIACLIETRNKF